MALATPMAWGAATAAVLWLLTVDPAVRGDDVLGSTGSRIAVTVLLAVIGGGIARLVDRRGRDERDAPISRPIALAVVGATPPVALAVTALAVSGAPTRGSVVAVSGLAVGAVVAVVIRLTGEVDRVRDAIDRRGRRRAGALVENGSDVVLVVDVDGRIRYASPGLSRTLGHLPAEWDGRDVADLGADESDRDLIGSRLAAAGADAGVRSIEFEVTLGCHDGQRRHAEGVVVDRRNDGAIGGLVVTFRDITEQRDLERQLSHRAFHDELTGLANRALFHTQIEQALADHDRTGDRAAVCFVDLDGFKRVNDERGHAAGDELLITVAERIRAAVRASDVVARLSGDEFGVLLRGVQHPDDAERVAGELVAVLGRPASLAVGEVCISASVGVALLPDHGTTPEELLRQSDAAMYRAKRVRGTYRFVGAEDDVETA